MDRNDDRWDLEYGEPGDADAPIMLDGGVGGEPTDDAYSGPRADGLPPVDPPPAERQTTSFGQRVGAGLATFWRWTVRISALAVLALAVYGAWSLDRVTREARESKVVDIEVDRWDPEIAEAERRRAAQLEEVRARRRRPVVARRDEPMAQLERSPDEQRAEELIRPSTERPERKPDQPKLKPVPTTVLANLDELRRRNLAIPVAGVEKSQLQDTFNDARSGGRVHNALDILAPKGTAVVAADDGKVVRLFDSRLGGLSVYQVDPSDNFVYYYAHLDGYAKGLKDNTKVRRGQLLGYVGTTGNAPDHVPHLHFSIHRKEPGGSFWRGEEFNPFDVYR